MKSFITIILILIFSGCFAQVQTVVEEERVGPGIKNGRVSRAAEFGYFTNLTPFKLYSKPTRSDIRSDTARVDNADRLTIKFKVPLYNGSYNKVIFGFKHVKESFSIKRERDLADYFSNINDRQLKSIGGAIYTSHYLTGRRFFTTKAELSFNGDYNNHQLHFEQLYKLNISMMYGKSKNENLAYGVGLYYSQRLGRRNMYPVLMLQKNFNEKWAVTTLFPANLNFQYRPAPNAFITMGYELQGSNYTLVYDRPPVEAFRIAELRVNELDFPIKYEQRVYDFIWFELAAGYTWYFNYRFDSKGPKRSRPYIRNSTPGFLFGEMSLILAIPKKFRDRPVE